MKKIKIRNNCNAVSAPLEFTIAFGILLMGLSILFVAANTMFAPYDVPDFDIRAKAMELCDVIIGNPGNPNNWDEDFGNMDKFGLAYHDGSKITYGVLDQAKLTELDKRLNEDAVGYYGDADGDYTIIKNSLDLDTGNSVYDFALIIQKSTETEPPIYGKFYDDAVVARSFTRNIIITNGALKQDGTITVIFFT